MALAACKGGQGGGQLASSAPGAAPPPVQETTVLGTPPDLAGRWLSLGWIELPDGRTVSAPFLWEIAVRDGKPVMTHQFVSLPPAQKAVLDKANADGKAWQPSPDELAQLRAAWDGLPVEDMHVSKVANEILGKDGFDDSMKSEARSKDALWAVRQRMDFNAAAAPLVRQVTVYSTLAPSDGGYTGNFDYGQVAAAPFPIPLAYKGTFRLYRLGDPTPPPGFLRRVLDSFTGCGRRRSAS